MYAYILTKYLIINESSHLQVDFFWINRDQRSFEWFVNLLSQLEMEQAELGIAMERFLEMHMYITSALQKNDMKAVTLQLAMDLVHQMVRNRQISILLRYFSTFSYYYWCKSNEQCLHHCLIKVLFSPHIFNLTYVYYVHET